VLALAFIKPLIGLFGYVAHTDLHSHILLVPLVTVYLLWIHWKTLPRTYHSSWGWAMLPAAMGAGALCMLFFAPASQDHGHGAPPWSQNDTLALWAFAFFCFVIAGGFLFLGKDWMRAAAFPMAFLIFLVPLPDKMVYALETGSKYASAEAANMFFHLTGTPVLRESPLVFRLPNITMEVAQECSGIRSSWVLFITGLLAAHLFLHSPWRRFALIALIIPLGVLRNGFRILVLGLLCVHIGPHMIDSAIHHRGGPIFFALSLVPLFGLLWGLWRGERRGGAAVLAAQNAETLAKANAEKLKS